MTSDGPLRSDAQLALPLQPDEARPLSSHDLPSAAALLDGDAAARASALDTHQSFIVRAPAGSGKTELLTQRVLALLAHAEAPEEIVAITFTRKAAAEMKDRLLEALAHVAAANGNDSQQKQHQKRTMELARRVAARDRELGWQLASNPARLRVQTIDALALYIARQLPITTRFAAITQVTERAEPLYDAAAHATLALIDSQEEQNSGRCAARRTSIDAPRQRLAASTSSAERNARAARSVVASRGPPRPRGTRGADAERVFTAD